MQSHYNTLLCERPETGDGMVMRVWVLGTRENALMAYFCVLKTLGLFLRRECIRVFFSLVVGELVVGREGNGFLFGGES